MKKKVILSLLLFLFLASYFSVFALAAVNTTQCGKTDDTCKINNGYACLKDKIDTKTCSRLGADEKVFSLISSNQCKPDVLGDPKYKNDLRYTSLALLGGATENDPESWLVSKNRSTTNLDWFLEIESSDVAACTLSYGSSSTTYSVSINADKTLTSNSLSGSCFTLATGGYWLKINNNCFSKDLTVSCDKSFLTSLLYQKQGASTIYVSDKTHSSSAGGKTTENVQSLCFGVSATCDYEGSLWAALVLNSLKHDVSPYLPYLITNIDDNKKFLPEAFLNLLTGQYQNELLSKQISDKWWLADSTNDKFYDTSLASYVLQYDNSLQKQNSVRWLLDEAQSADGCWNNDDIRDTAFVLYALQPRSSFGKVIDSTVDCEAAGYNCMSGISCSQATGNELKSYTCSGPFVCCDKKKVLQSCSVQGGEICSSSQSCTGGTIAQASDALTSQVCCVGGTCASKNETTQLSACESASGTCRIGSCLSGEKQSFETCEFGSDLCCLPQKQSSSGSVVWVLLLLVLIAGVVFGIIYREKLRRLWFQIKSRFFKGGSKPSYSGRPGPGLPPSSMFPRRLLPVQRPSAKPSKTRGELDEVLKKLKDMGK